MLLFKVKLFMLIPSVLLVLGSCGRSTKTSAAKADVTRVAGLVIQRNSHVQLEASTVSRIADIRNGRAPKRLVIDLFPDTQIHLSRVTIISKGKGGVAVVAKIAKPAKGDAELFVASNGHITGTFLMGDKRFLLQGETKGGFEVAELTRATPARELPPVKRRPRGTPMVVKSGPSAPVEVDVMVVFDRKIEEDLLSTGLSTAQALLSIEGLVQTAFARANAELVDSGIHTQLLLVGTEDSGYVGSGRIGDDLDRLQSTNDGYMDSVHARRDVLGADIVIFLARDSEGGHTGQANLAVVSSDADDDSAFAVVRYDRLASHHTLTHEIGHIFGAYHDKDNDGGIILLPQYAHGLRSKDWGWRTIMAYDCWDDDSKVDECPRINYFSTPLIRHSDGNRLGTKSNEDNARRLNETSNTVAGFRLRGPRVTLYEGAGATQDAVCTVSLESNTTLVFTDNSNTRYCDNDEAKSLRLIDVPPGKVIRLYDNANGSTQDDWFEIVVKQHVADKIIQDFQSGFADSDVSLIFHSNNSLNGKVSRLEVSDSATGAVIDFHEGNDGTENLVCSVPAAQQTNLDFTNHSDCDNDEARSMTLHQLQAGTILRLYDSPDASQHEPWAEIHVKSFLSEERTIGSFDTSSSTPEVDIVKHHSDALDGKLSRLEVRGVPTGATMDLYEGTSASQNLVCSLGIAQTQSIDFTNHAECDNDEAKSAVLYDVPADTLLMFYDSPRGNKNDDWTAVLTKQHLNVLSLPDLVSTSRPATHDILYSRHNGFDGKLSRVEIRLNEEIPSYVDFYENRNGKGDKVCEVALEDKTVEFKNNGACDNDEARSAKFRFVKAGTIVRVYDDPNCRESDDWTEVEFKVDLFDRTIGRFSHSTDNSDIRQTYHSKNGLDGKISCITIDVP